MPHPAKTLAGDRVLYYKAGHKDAHVAFVIKVHSDHVADLVFYCPEMHGWYEAGSVTFGENEGGSYFVNPEG